MKSATEEVRMERLDKHVKSATEDSISATDFSSLQNFNFMSILTKTIPIITSFMAKYADNPDVSASLRICKEQYEMMPDSINNALAALAVRNAEEVTFQCGSIKSYHMSCAVAFAESKNYRVIPFAADAKVVCDIASN